MAKARVTTSQDGKSTVVWIYCPGCKCSHGFTVKAPGFKGWTWNGSVDSPTFTPSMLCNKDDPGTRCHSFVENGKIKFLSDCHHELKNSTVELPDTE